MQQIRNIQTIRQDHCPVQVKPTTRRGLQLNKAYLTHGSEESVCFAAIFRIGSRMP